MNRERVRRVQLSKLKPFGSRERKQLDHLVSPLVESSLVRHKQSEVGEEKGENPQCSLDLFYYRIILLERRRNKDLQTVGHTEKSENKFHREAELIILFVILFFSSVF